MKIVQYLRDMFSLLKEKVKVAWSRLRGQDSEILDRLKQTVAGFLTSPLSDTEYALLKRVSGIVGTAVAVYLTLAAGLNMALMVLGLCLFFSVGLHKVTGQVREPGQEAI
jgi:hypothetical protein